MLAPDQRPPGRPRDDAAAPALLAAARRLVVAHGYEGVSIQMIAAEAHVGRQTLYRRWKGKAELVLDAFLESAEKSESPTPDDTAAVALERFLRQVFDNLRQDGPAIRNLIASAQHDVEFMEVFRARFVFPREKVVLEILERGVKAGEIAADAPLPVAAAMLHGAFWYPLLLGQVPGGDYASDVVRLIFRGLGGVVAPRSV